MAAPKLIQMASVGIGRISIDPARIRGEGGPSDPRIVIPLKIEMFLQPENRQLAVVRLTGSLHSDERASPEARIGTPMSVDLIKGMPCRSLPNVSSEHIIELRFALTPSLIRFLDDLRHASPGSGFTLYAGIEVVVCWLKYTGNAAPLHIGGPWPSSVGMFSELQVFWEAAVDPVEARIEPSAWAERILPALGQDRIRFIEINLPAGRSDVIGWFDKARFELDQARYPESIGICRGIQNFWEQSIGATPPKYPVAQVLRERLGWSADDARCKCLDYLWTGLDALVNPPHHPERGEQAYTASDARLCLYLVTVLSEYVSTLTGHQ